jgi:hypothetical protein
MWPFLQCIQSTLLLRVFVNKSSCLLGPPRNPCPKRCSPFPRASHIAKRHDLGWRRASIAWREMSNFTLKLARLVAFLCSFLSVGLVGAKCGSQLRSLSWDGCVTALPCKPPQHSASIEARLNCHLQHFVFALKCRLIWRPPSPCAMEQAVFYDDMSIATATDRSIKTAVQASSAVQGTRIPLRNKSCVHCFDEIARITVGIPWGLDD